MMVTIPLTIAVPASYVTILINRLVKPFIFAHFSVIEIVVVRLATGTCNLVNIKEDQAKQLCQSRNVGHHPKHNLVLSLGLNQNIGSTILVAVLSTHTLIR